MPVALITGVTGQDGAYLSRFLLKKGYTVHGLQRRTSSPNMTRINCLCSGLIRHSNFQLHYGDLTDTTNLIRLLQIVRPDEVYNLAAQSHVGHSFNSPEYTANCDAIGTLRLLEAIRILKLEKKTRFYQASSSEMYGNTSEHPQTETTHFHPRSPYGISKLYAYWTTVNYREAYNIHASNGILFNHESPYRGDSFVTQKTIRAIKKIIQGTQETLVLGNIDAKRDWGHASDYVEGMWKMLQQPTADDYVLSTGIAYSVRDFVEKAFAYVDIKLCWTGSGLNETGINAKNGKQLVKVDKTYFRPTEINVLLGDSSKIRKKLGWKANITFDELIREMIESELKRDDETSNNL